MKTDVTLYQDEKIRNIYNEKAKDNSIKKEYGLTREIVENISREKNEDKWILDLRLKALDLYYKLENPTWGPDISYFDVNQIATYVKSNSKEERNWEDVPEDIKNVFDKLGIPEAEKKSLAGVGAQFDSEVLR